MPEDVQGDEPEEGAGQKRSWASGFARSFGWLWKRGNVEARRLAAAAKTERNRDKLRDEAEDRAAPPPLGSFPSSPSGDQSVGDDPFADRPDAPGGGAVADPPTIAAEISPPDAPAEAPPLADTDAPDPQGSEIPPPDVAAPGPQGSEMPPVEVPAAPPPVVPPSGSRGVATMPGQSSIGFTPSPAAPVPPRQVPPPAEPERPQTPQERVQANAAMESAARRMRMGLAPTPSTTASSTEPTPASPAPIPQAGSEAPGGPAAAGQAAEEAVEAAGAPPPPAGEVPPPQEFPQSKAMSTELPGAPVSQPPFDAPYDQVTSRGVRYTEDFGGSGPAGVQPPVSDTRGQVEPPGGPLTFTDRDFADAGLAGPDGTGGAGSSVGESPGLPDSRELPPGHAGDPFSPRPSEESAPRAREPVAQPTEETIGGSGGGDNTQSITAAIESLRDLVIEQGVQITEMQGQLDELLAREPTGGVGP